LLNKKPERIKMKAIVTKIVEVDADTLEDAIPKFKDGKTISITARDAASVQVIPQMQGRPQMQHPRST
jgi:hypothetical protein